MKVNKKLMKAFASTKVPLVVAYKNSFPVKSKVEFQAYKCTATNTTIVTNANIKAFSPITGKPMVKIETSSEMMPVAEIKELPVIARSNGFLIAAAEDVVASLGSKMYSILSGEELDLEEVVDLDELNEDEIEESNEELEDDVEIDLEESSDDTDEDEEIEIDLDEASDSEDEDDDNLEDDVEIDLEESSDDAQETVDEIDEIVDEEREEEEDVNIEESKTKKTRVKASETLKKDELNDTKVDDVSGKPEMDENELNNTMVDDVTASEEKETENTNESQEEINEELEKDVDKNLGNQTLEESSTEDDSEDEDADETTEEEETEASTEETEDENKELDDEELEVELEEEACDDTNKIVIEKSCGDGIDVMEKIEESEDEDDVEDIDEEDIEDIVDIEESCGDEDFKEVVLSAVKSNRKISYNMVKANNKPKNVEIVESSDKTYLMFDGKPVATMSKEQSTNDIQTLYSKPVALLTALRAAIDENGLTEEINSAFGIKPIKINIKASKVMRNNLKEGYKAMASKLSEAKTNHTERLAQSLSIASVGINKGLFGTNKFRADFIKQLTMAGVMDAEDIVNEIFAKHGEEYLKEIIEKAKELVSSDDSERNATAKLVTTAAFNKSMTDKVKMSYVHKPVESKERQEVKASYPTDAPTSFTGLFNSIGNKY